MTSDDDGLGYSPATGTAQADTTIHTSSVGLDARLVEIDAGDRPIRAYVASPLGKEEAPLLLVLSEAFGLHEHIADVVRRFAHQGYYAIAPDLMVRQGDPLSYDDVDTLVRDLLLKIPDGQVMSDLDATVTWARENGASGGWLAATGFCWGGRWTWLYAAHRQMDAAVVWYGIVDGSSTFPDDPSLFPRQPIDLTDDLRAPVLGLYGGRDEAIPLDTIRTMERRLSEGDAQARESQIHIYSQAGHAFFADYRQSYIADVAKDAWTRCLDWLGSHGIKT